MQQPINPSAGETPSSPGPALLTGAALLGGAALLAATPRVAAASSIFLSLSNIPGSGDVKVLNYALTLELIEADLYVQALMRLTTGGTNALGQTITGLGVAASDPFAVYLKEFGGVEARHRDFLIGALTTSAISVLTLSGAKFDFGINTFDKAGLLNFMIGVEATGVAAYIGVLPLLTVGSTYLSSAAAIQGTEARHTAALTVIKNQLFSSTDSPAPVYTSFQGRDRGQLPDTVLAGVSKYIVLGK